MNQLCIANRPTTLCGWRADVAGLNVLLSTRLGQHRQVATAGERASDVGSLCGSSRDDDGQRTDQRRCGVPLKLLVDLLIGVPLGGSTGMLSP